jgi:hypothetical protein
MITFANVSRKDESIVAFGVKEIGPYYWVGHCENGVNHSAGQTFQAPVSGVLKRIKLFSSVVYGASNTTLSIYKFDKSNYTFAEKQSETTKHITKANENQWIEFDFLNVMVDKDSHYAFKIECKGEGMLAIAECPWHMQDPYAEGVEWIGSSSSGDGSFYEDFDLAFEGEIGPSLNTKFV